MDLFFSQIDSMSKYTLFKSILPNIKIKEGVTGSMLNYRIGVTWKYDEI